MPNQTALMRRSTLALARSGFSSPIPRKMRSTTPTTRDYTSSMPIPTKSRLQNSGAMHKSLRKILTIPHIVLSYTMPTRGSSSDSFHSAKRASTTNSSSQSPTTSSTPSGLPIVSSSSKPMPCTSIGVPTTRIETLACPCLLTTITRLKHKTTITQIIPIKIIIPNPIPIIHLKNEFGTAKRSHSIARSPETITVATPMASWSGINRQSDFPTTSFHIGDGLEPRSMQPRRFAASERAIPMRSASPTI